MFGVEMSLKDSVIIVAGWIVLCVSCGWLTGQVAQMLTMV